MQGASAAQRDQHPGPGIDTPLHAHHVQGRDHLLYGNGEDALRARVAVEPEFRREAVDRGRRRVRLQRDGVADAEIPAEAPENDVGVGDGGLQAPAPVGRRARVGTGRSRAHAQCASRIRPRDAASAGRHRVDVQHGQVDGVPGNHASVGPARSAVDDQGDVARRSAHVERQRHGGAIGRGDIRGPDHSPCRTREDCARCMRGGVRQRHEPAARLHDHRLGQPGSPCTFAERAQVVGEHRGEVGIECCGGDAFVLAYLGQHIAGRAHVHPGQLLTQPLGDPLLVLRVGVREQEAHGDGLGGDFACPPHHLRDSLIGERANHAVGPDPLGCRDRAIRRYQRRRVRPVEPVERRTILAPQLQDILEALGGHQGGAGSGALQHGVGAHGHAVGHPLHKAGRNARHGERREHGADHALALIPGSGGHLRAAHDAIRDDHGVGEGSADVHADQRAGGSTPVGIYHDHGI